MNHTITTTLESKIYNFLNYESKDKNVTKKSIIEDALEDYMQKQLENDVKNGFQDRYEEYRDINSDLINAQVCSLKN